jgi:hypothetical protein
MSLGDRLRGLIDPLDPAVAAWLRRELPRLIASGVITAEQANAIGNRYGIGAVWVQNAAPTSSEASPAAAPAAIDDGEAPALAASTPTSADPATTPSGRARPPQPATQPWTADPPAAGLAREAEPASGEPTAYESGLAPGAPDLALAGPRPRAASPFFADHAISIVLYLGAFLIVTSVAIFLAYSWGDIEGEAKLGLLILLNAAFLGVAALCLRYPAVRVAGRTFLAIGVLLVPVNVAAAYVLVFARGPIPAAAFWLLGALLSGSLHALLSWRLGSRGYGALAALAGPVAADALTWLISPDPAWLGPPAALALAATLTATRLRPAAPLAQATRFVSAGLLPLAVLIALPTVDSTDVTALAAPITILLSSAALAWEAARRGWTWWCGAAASLVLMLFIGFAITGASPANLPPLIVALIVSCWISAAVARRLAGRQALVWDMAALVPALVYPAFAWGSDTAGATLLANAVLLASALAYVRRSTFPAYPAVLAADGLYIKLLAIFGNPNSPSWKLGVALWPLGIVWTGLALTVPRRLVGPFAVGALLTLLVAAGLTAEQPWWHAGIASWAALGTIFLAWRLRLGLVLLAAAPWLMLGLFQIGVSQELAVPYRLALMGLGGWLLLGVALTRPPGIVADAPRSAQPAAPDEHPVGDTQPADEPGLAPTRPAVAARSYSPRDADWAGCARVGAAGITTLAALIVSSYADGVDTDDWLLATLLAWVNLSLLFAAWTWSARSRDVGVIAALALAPALMAGIGRLHPGDLQAYALPVGLYLLAVAMVVRRDGRPGRLIVATVIATIGLLAMLGTSVVQSVGRAWIGYTILTLAEGLVLAAIGIALRWRVLVIGGMAGIVVIAVRQLFDAVSALPGWAILGGIGVLLLGLALMLLVARAKLAAAGRAATERWSTWD